MSEVVAMKSSYEIQCDSCGNELSARIVGDTIYVKPCEFCMEDEYKNGWDEGHGVKERENQS